MRHVFVETNFLIDLLRPFPVRDAESLFARIDTDVVLYIPWVSVSEAKRTLTSKVISADLGFANLVQKFGVKRLQNGEIAEADMKPIQDLAATVKEARADALRNVNTAVDQTVSRMTVIPPSPGVVAKTVALYPVKLLPPFDEMVLGAVLYKAEELSRAGTSELFFCNKNTKDFAPTSGNNLQAAYTSCGLAYCANFSVP